jgi:hypothetical protein
MLVIYPLNRVGAFTKFGTKTIINFSTGVLIEVALPGSPTVSVISYYSASNWNRFAPVGFVLYCRCLILVTRQ